MTIRGRDIPIPPSAPDDVGGGREPSSACIAAPAVKGAEDGDGANMGESFIISMALSDSILVLILTKQHPLLVPSGLRIM